MNEIVASLTDIAARLRAQGFEEAEVFHKRGRSRRFEIGCHGRVAGFAHEEGWAVRAGDERSSFFFSSTGEPRVPDRWPEPDGRPIRLPPALPIPEWKSPADLEAPVIVDQEAIALLEAIERALVEEMAGGRVLRAVLDEGSSEIALVNTRGLQVNFRSRAAALELQVTCPPVHGEGATFYLAEREARNFNPLALARRAANRLVLAREGKAPDRDRGEILLGPAVATQLVAGLLPVLVGEGAEENVKRFQDRRGQLGSPLLTVIDDGRLRGGIVETPVDGEGYPCREALLIEEGTYRQPLVSWREAKSPHEATGCMRRPSWRDLPLPGPSHLFVRPAVDVATSSLVSSVVRGYYFVESTAAGHFDIDEDRFSLPVCGFVLRQGKADSPVGGAWLCGSFSAFLRGIQAVARDLTFFPLRGMIGSPTLLVTGLEVRSRPD